MLKHKLTEI